ncbi:hypothetical protein JVW24_25730, partial [Vibrio cholerae O1]|nr:hypothetical protein [Vibrio cholerae O1]
LYLSGWQYVWLAMILSTFGFILFIKAKKESRQAISVKEWAGMFIVALLGVLAILVLICGAKSGTALDLRGL